MKSELAIKRDEWFESNEGLGCLTDGILKPGCEIYLRNRLESAFLAGAKAGEEIYRAESARAYKDSKP